jgi:plasmid rolling circle replication initiator protein Rep
MSCRTPEELSPVVYRDFGESNCVSPNANTTDEFLSDASPRHKPWDQHRAEADEVSDIFANSQFSRHQRYAKRVEWCSQVLEFARDPPTDLFQSERKLKLTNSWFCRVRHCPVCQWRRALQWQARLYQALPKLLIDYPDARFLFLTLTVRNCPIHELRSTLILLARSWQRLTQLSIWPAIGWIRATEITRSQKDRSAHPHFHALLMVPPSYFQAEYLRQEQWAELWQHSLQVDYRPVVDVRVIRQNTKRSRVSVNQVNIPQMWAIVSEILKYAVKPSDMIRDHDWFLSLVDQVHKMRSVAVGGVLKPYMRARKRDDWITEPAEEEANANAERLFFGWKMEVKKYRRLHMS